MPLNLYTVHYWSDIDWGWTEYDALAESEEQIRAKVDKQCGLEQRRAPFKKDPKDSLTVTCHGLVELPYITDRRTI